MPGCAHVVRGVSMSTLVCRSSPRNLTSGSISLTEGIRCGRRAAALAIQCRPSTALGNQSDSARIFAGNGHAFSFTSPGGLLFLIIRCNAALRWELKNLAGSDVFWALVPVSQSAWALQSGWVFSALQV